MTKHNLRLKELRLENNLLQRSVAEYLGCRQQTLSRYEIGSLEPSITVLIKLSEFYNTSVDYIIGITDEKTPYKRTEN